MWPAGWIVQGRPTSLRPPLRVVVNIGANHKVAGSLVLLFEEVVASHVGVGGLQRGPRHVSRIMTLGASRFVAGSSMIYAQCSGKSEIRNHTAQFRDANSMA